MKCLSRVSGVYYKSAYSESKLAYIGASARKVELVVVVFFGRVEYMVQRGREIAHNERGERMVWSGRARTHTHEFCLSFLSAARPSLLLMGAPQRNAPGQEEVCAGGQLLAALRRCRDSFFQLYMYM